MWQRFHEGYWDRHACYVAVIVTVRFFFWEKPAKNLNNHLLSTVLFSSWKLNIHFLLLQNIQFHCVLLFDSRNLNKTLWLLYCALSEDCSRCYLTAFSWLTLCHTLASHWNIKQASVTPVTICSLIPHKQSVYSKCPVMQL